MRWRRCDRRGRYAKTLDSLAGEAQQGGHQRERGGHTGDHKVLCTQTATVLMSARCVSIGVKVGIDA